MRRSERRKEDGTWKEGGREWLRRILCVIGGASLFNSIEAERERGGETLELEEFEVRTTNEEAQTGSEFTE